MRSSFASRLFGGFVLAFALGLTIIGGRAKVLEDREFELRQSEWAGRELQLAAAALPPVTLTHSHRHELDAWCDRMGRASGVRLTLIATDGTLLGDSAIPEDSLALAENHRDRPEVKQALAQGRGWAHRISHTLHEPLWYAAIPVGKAGAPGPVLRLSVRASLVTAERRAQTQLLLFALAVVLASASLISLGAGRLLSVRLRSVLDAAQRMGEGELGARAPETPDDEIGRTGRALNRMGARLEQRLDEVREERDQRETILTHMAEGVALVDSQGRVVQANMGLARILGLPRPPASGKLFLEEVRQPALASLLERARAGSGPLSEEITFYMPEQRVVEATVVQLGTAGQPSAQLLVVHDLSRVKQLERVRQEFVANVSHELKTPLTLIRGSAETLLDGGLDDARNRRDFVEKIDRHAVRLQAIVDDLLQLARLEQSGVRVDRRDLNLCIVARNVAGAHEQAAARKGLGLVLDLPPEGAFAAGDPELLERALSNLVDNAVKYTAAGELRMRVGHGDGRAWCEVSDTGPGIPPESLGRIFERFYRVDQGRSRELGGTGLGLSIVRHSVELMGGNVTVRSELGAGTTFRIELESAPGG